MSGYSHIPPRHGQTSSHSNDGPDYGPDPPSRYTSSRGHPYTGDMGAPSSLPRNSKSWGGARGGAYGSEQGRYERDMRNVRGDGHNRGDREDPRCRASSRGGPGQPIERRPRSHSPPDRHQPSHSATYGLSQSIDDRRPSYKESGTSSVYRARVPEVSEPPPPTNSPPPIASASRSVTPVVTARQPYMALPSNPFPERLIDDVSEMLKDATSHEGADVRQKPLSPDQASDLVRLCLWFSESLEAARRWQTLQSQLKVVQTLRTTALLRPDYDAVSKDFDKTIADKKRAIVIAREALEQILVQFAAALTPVLSHVMLEKGVPNLEKVDTNPVDEGKQERVEKEKGKVQETVITLNLGTPAVGLSEDVEMSLGTSTEQPGGVDQDEVQQRPNRLKRRFAKIDETVEDIGARIKYLEQQVVDNAETVHEWIEYFPPGAIEELKEEIEGLKRKPKRIRAPTAAAASEAPSKRLREPEQLATPSASAPPPPMATPAGATTTSSDARFARLEAQVLALEAERTSLRKEVATIQDERTIEKAAMQDSIHAAVAAALEKYAPEINSKIQKVNDSVHVLRQVQQTTFDSMHAEVDSLRKLCPMPNGNEPGNHVKT